MEKRIYLKSLGGFDRKKFITLFFNNYDFLKPNVKALEDTPKDYLSQLYYVFYNSNIIGNQVTFGIYQKKGFLPFRRPMIGMITAFGYNKETNEIEVGYLLAEEFTKHGYMKEALELIEKWLKRQKIYNVRLEIGLTNFASIKLAQKCGYTFQYTTDEDDVYKKALV